MANKRLDTMVIKQLILLYGQGYSNRKIASQLNISRNTVNRYIKQIKASGQDISELQSWSEERLGAVFEDSHRAIPDRLQTLQSYFPEILKASKQVGFTYQKMWESYRKDHADGYSYTQYLEHYHRWKDQHQLPSLKMTHKVGECLYVDYAGKKLHWVDRNTGELKPVEVFISCLPASGLMYVEVSENQQQPSFIRSMINCLDYYGGVPTVSITDNLKSAVHKSCKYEPVTNRVFREMGLHYGMALNPTRPYRPKDKAMVERMVKMVYQEIYFIIRDEIFFSPTQLNDRIQELLEKNINDKKYSQSDYSRRELFESIERSELKPLPPQPYQVKQIRRSKVQRTGHVYLSEDKHYYSVPYRYIGHSTRIHYTDRIVEVYFNHQRIATHMRNRQSRAYTTKPQHLLPQHQKYLQWNPEYFIEKSKMIGPNCTQYIRRLFAQSGYTQTKYKMAMGIIQLKRFFEISRIEKACQIAYMHPWSSYQKVKNILDKKVDQIQDLFTQTDLESTSHIPPHQNIRGADYYSQL